MISNTPDYQKRMRDLQAKYSMRGNRPSKKVIRDEMKSLHLQDLERKLAFSQLSQQKQKADLSHRMRSFQLGMAKDELKERKQQLPWQMGIGIATGLYSALEGKRRANILADQEKKREDRFNDIMSNYGGTSVMPHIPMGL